MFENNNFLFLLNYDATHDYSCETSGCYDEGICRCSTIEDVIITNVYLRKLSINILERFEDDMISTNRNKKISAILWGYDYDELNLYCIERILTINKVWSEDSWSPQICCGYYGQEIEDILLKSEIFDKISNQIHSVLNIDTLEEKIYYLLNLEYSKVLDSLVDKKMSIQVIDFEQITFPQKSHFDKVKLKNLDYIKNYTGIKGVVRKYGNEYRVVDGYHRLCANELKKVKVIVVE
jgi:hypothetical protein